MRRCLQAQLLGYKEPERSVGRFRFLDHSSQGALASMASDHSVWGILGVVVYKRVNTTALSGSIGLLFLGNKDPELDTILGGAILIPSYLFFKFVSGPDCSIWLLLLLILPFSVFGKRVDIALNMNIHTKVPKLNMLLVPENRHFAQFLKEYFCCVTIVRTLLVTT